MNQTIYRSTNLLPSPIRHTHTFRRVQTLDNAVRCVDFDFDISVPIGTYNNNICIVWSREKSNRNDVESIEINCSWISNVLYRWSMHFMHKKRSRNHSNIQWTGSRVKNRRNIGRSLLVPGLFTLHLRFIRTILTVDWINSLNLFRFYLHLGWRFQRWTKWNMFTVLEQNIGVRWILQISSSGTFAATKFQIQEPRSGNCWNKNWNYCWYRCGYIIDGWCHCWQYTLWLRLRSRRRPKSHRKKGIEWYKSIS